MSQASTNNLTEEIIQQLLAAVGVESEEDTKYNLDAFDYNWRQPNYFNSSQINKIDLFTEKVANGLTVTFTQLFNSDFEVQITSTTQRFAEEFAPPKNVQNDYYLTIGTEDETFGLIGIPSKTAITWAAQLLGDSKSVENSDRDLSQLEESLLYDAACSVVKAFSDSCDNYDLHPVGEIVIGEIPIKSDGTEELCKISFRVKELESENSSDAYFLILCEKLQTLLKQKVETSEEISAQDISEAMLEHVSKIPVSVTVRLASTVLNLEEMVSLQANDILLLDKKTDDPIELIVEGKTVLRGRPAKSNGNFAVVITELCNTK